jgi:hypothetical protein
MASDTSQSTERFQTLTTVLIALLSTAVALVAAQAAVISGNVTEANQNGVLAAINRQRTDGRSLILVARNRRALDDYRFNRSLYSLTNEYVQTEFDAGRSAHETRLRQEASAQLEESNLAYQHLDSGYLVYDDALQDYTGFDDTTYLTDEQQTASIYEDIDSTDNFTEADTLWTQAMAMGASLIVLFFAVMFLTWAQITRSMLKWVWLAAGVLIALAVGVAYLIAWLTGMFA